MSRRPGRDGLFSRRSSLGGPNRHHQSRSGPPDDPYGPIGPRKQPESSARAARLSVAHRVSGCGRWHQSPTVGQRLGHLPCTAAGRWMRPSACAELRSHPRARPGGVQDRVRGLEGISESVASRSARSDRARLAASFRRMSLSEVSPKRCARYRSHERGRRPCPEGRDADRTSAPCRHSRVDSCPVGAGHHHALRRSSTPSRWPRTGRERGSRPNRAAGSCSLPTASNCARPGSPRRAPAELPRGELSV